MTMTLEELDELVAQTKTDNILVLWFDDIFVSIHDNTIYYDSCNARPYKDGRNYIVNNISKYEFVTKEQLIKYSRDSISKSLERELKNPESSASTIVKDVEEMKNKVCCVKGIPDEYGLLLGAVSSDEDYYWLTMDRFRQLRFNTCMDSMELLSEIPEDMNHIIKWLETDKEDLYNYVKEKLPYWSVPMTPLS